MDNEINNKSNNKNTIYIVIIVILLIVLGVIGFLIYQKTKQEKEVLDNPINNNETVNNSNSNNSNTERIDNIALADQTFKKYVVDDDYLAMTIYNFSDEYKTILAIKNTEPVKIDATCDEIFKADENHYQIENENDMFWVYQNKETDTYYGGACYALYDGSQNLYEYESVNETYHKLFNSGNALKSISQFELYYESIDIYAYSTSKNGYVALSCECGGTGHHEEYHIYEGYIQNDELHVVFGFLAYELEDYVDEEGTILKIKVDKDNYATVNVKIDSEKRHIITNIDEIFLNQRDKIPVYEMIFTKDNDNYIFKSLTKVK